ALSKLLEPHIVAWSELSSRMPDVELQSEAFERFDFEAEVLEANFHIGVFPPVPFVFLVKPIHSFERQARDRVIASLQIDDFVHTKKLAEWFPQKPKRAINFLSFSFPSTHQELRRRPIKKSSSHSLRRQPVANLRAELDTAAGKIAALFLEAHVI